MANNKNNIPTNVPKYTADIKFDEIFSKVFDGKGLKKEEVALLPDDQLIGLFTFMSCMAARADNIASQAKAIINTRDLTSLTSLGGGEVEVIVKNADRGGEELGSTWIRTETTTTASISNEKNRTQVMIALEPTIQDADGFKALGERLNQDWLAAHPSLGKYTKVMIELQRDLLYRDKANGTLDPTVANLLSEKVNTRRVTSFREAPPKPATEEGK